MKPKAFLLSGLLLVSCFAFAQSKSTTDPRPKPKREYPAVGMSVTDLENAIKQIKVLLPEGESHILYMNLHDPNQIKIDTGRQDGPRAGRGKFYEFERVDGKWTKTAEGEWVS